MSLVINNYKTCTNIIMEYKKIKSINLFLIGIAYQSCTNKMRLSLAPLSTYDCLSYFPCFAFVSCSSPCSLLSLTPSVPLKSHLKKLNTNPSSPEKGG